MTQACTNILLTKFLSHACKSPKFCLDNILYRTVNIFHVDTYINFNIYAINLI